MSSKRRKGKKGKRGRKVIQPGKANKVIVSNVKARNLTKKNMWQVSTSFIDKKKEQKKRGHDENI